MNLHPYAERLSAFLARPIVRREAIWETDSGLGVMPHPSVGMLYATRGAGKTLTALDLGLRVAAGAPWGPYRRNRNGHRNRNEEQPPEGRNVLFVDGEMPEADLQDRLRAIAGTPELQRGIPQCWLLGSDRLAGENTELNLAKEVTRGALQAVTEDLSIDFLVLDNWTSLFRGLDENDNSAIAPVALWLARLRHNGTSTLLIHHAGKEGRQRGASAREDVLDYSIKLRTQTRQPPVWRLEWDKTRCGLPDPTFFVLERTEAGTIVLRDNLEDRVVAQLRLAARPMTTPELAEALGQRRAGTGALRTALRSLEQANRVCSSERNRQGATGRPAREWSLTGGDQ